MYRLVRHCVFVSFVLNSHISFQPAMSWNWANVLAPKNKEIERNCNEEPQLKHHYIFAHFCIILYHCQHHLHLFLYLSLSVGLSQPALKITGGAFGKYISIKKFAPLGPFPARLRCLFFVLRTFVYIKCWFAISCTCYNVVLVGGKWSPNVPNVPSQEDMVYIVVLVRICIARSFPCMHVASDREIATERGTCTNGLIY